MLKYIEISFDENGILTQKSQHVQFNLYEKLKNLKYIKSIRINILYNQVDRENKFCKIIGANDKICNIYASITIDEDNFTMNLTLRTYELLEELFLLNKWNIEDLENAKKESQKQNFNALIPFIKKKWNTKRTLSGEVKINYQPNYAEFLFYGFNNRKEIICVVSVFKARLNPMLFRLFLYDCNWENDKYIIRDQLNEIKFIINPNNCSIKNEFNPIENSIEELEGYLKAFDYLTDDIQSNSLLGLPD